MVTVPTAHHSPSMIIRSTGKNEDLACRSPQLVRYRSHGNRNPFVLSLRHKNMDTHPTAMATPTLQLFFLSFFFFFYFSTATATAVNRHSAFLPLVGNYLRPSYPHHLIGSPSAKRLRNSIQILRRLTVANHYLIESGAPSPFPIPSIAVGR